MTKAGAAESFRTKASQSDPAFDVRQYLDELASKFGHFGAAPDLDLQAVKEVPEGVEDPSGEAAPDWGVSMVPPQRWPSRGAVTAALAVHLVAVAALLGLYRYDTAFPGPEIPAAVRTHMTASVSPPRLLPKTVQQLGMSAQGPARSALLAAPSLPPDRSTRGWSASGSAQGSEATTALTMAPPTRLGAQIARSTSDVAVPAMKDELQSHIDKLLPTETAEATRRPAELHERVAQTETPIVAPYHATPTSTHQALRHLPSRGLPAIPRRTATREPQSPKQQLLLARKALADNNSPEARGLLEAAQTLIVFSPQSVSLERANIAARQITDALSMLNSGDAVNARTYLDRAITTMQPTS